MKISIIVPFHKKFGQYFAR